VEFLLVGTRKAPVKSAWPIPYQDSRMERSASSTGPKESNLRALIKSHLTESATPES